MTLVLQSSTGGNELVPALRTTARGIDPTQPLDQVRTMESLLSDSVGRPRMYAILAGAFGLLALMLASIGIYGVMAYAVSARTYKIGVRISLGASQRAILKQFLWEGLKQVLIGIALGLLGSMVLTRLIASMLYHVAPLDAGVALAGLAVLVITALLACYLPARRATRIDPLAAIRHE
jgi:ABC-type antimicrobial peptide transport system permease subunit